MRRDLTLVDRLKAEELKKQICELEASKGRSAARFAKYEYSTGEEQLATQLAFTENRRSIGRLSPVQTV